MPNPYPPPQPPSPAASTPLEAELVGRIRGHGPLPFSGYMARCLYDPFFGYYTRGLNFPDDTPGRDFLTAPTLTPLFGATLANWVAARWQRLGQPAAFTLAEVGPGNGALMHSLWHALPQAVRAAAQLHLVESSPVLTQRQRATLCDIPAQFSDTIASLSITQPTLCIANELLDAFPTDLFMRREGQWHQRVVMLDAHGALTLGWRPARQAPPLPAGWHPAEDALLEVSDSQSKWLRQLAAHLARSGGAALLLDYGHTTLPPEGGETLQALHRHTPVPLLHRPGETDLTAHVNMETCNQVFDNKGNVSDLSPFLLTHGLLTLAEPTITNPATQSALHRLLHPEKMGSLFKVLEVAA